MIRVINICSLIGLCVPEDQGFKAETLHHVANPRYEFQQLRLVYFFNWFQSVMEPMIYRAGQMTLEEI